MIWDAWKKINLTNSNRQAGSLACLHMSDKARSFVEGEECDNLKVWEYRTDVYDEESGDWVDTHIWYAYDYLGHLRTGLTFEKMQAVFEGFADLRAAFEALANAEEVN
ncbi:MAG: hypothetical protein K5637_01775 [Lachnospiraceae bacterium]|nr:hypothetical protein [Lachnospiraceae bacterium]